MIRDNISPRERQIRETLAGIRPGLDDEDLEPLGAQPAPDEFTRRMRAAQVERESTAFWICPGCRARVPGHGNVCDECGWDAETAR